MCQRWLLVLWGRWDQAGASCGFFSFSGLIWLEEHEALALQPPPARLGRAFIRDGGVQQDGGWVCGQMDRQLDTWVTLGQGMSAPTCCLGC